MTRKVIIFVLAAAAVLASWALTPTVYAISTTLTVNGYGDFSDLNPGDGICDTLSALAGDQCSLRAAIEELNALGPGAAPHRIEFNISGTGPFTIVPDSELPPINVPIDIVGETQSGASCPTASDPANIQIVLDGSNVTVSNSGKGFLIATNGGGSSISGFSIINFYDGIVLPSSFNTIRCNHIGVDASGTIGAGYYGMYATGHENVIGGATDADRNVISGNFYVGVTLYGDSNVVAGNYIGTEANGVNQERNGTGVRIYEGVDNVIGGFTVNERNVIAASVFNGVVVDASQSSTILNNYIGVNKNGSPSGNGDNGIALRFENSGTTVGDVNAPNIIAHNGENGIFVSEDSVENALQVNAIYDNELLGIDLEGTGEALGEVTPNDDLDSDSGANGLQNYPILNIANANGRIQGTINGASNNDITLLFYLNEQCDESGHGEGEQFLEAVDITIPSGSNELAFDLTLNVSLTTGQFVTATAIDIDTENSSEFSNCVLISDATYVVNSTIDIGDIALGDGFCDISVILGDQCTLRAAIEEINSASGNGLFRIIFDIPGAEPYVIAPASPFDAIRKTIVIDGTTQPNTSCPTDSNLPASLKIVLDGSNLSSGNGLTLAAGSGGSEIHGLVIGGFPGQGIQITSNNNLIACNHIGLDAVGTAAFGNGLNGIRVRGDNNQIGGLNSQLRNIVSGNEVSGIFLYAGANGNIVEGNFVGTNAAGDSAVGNGEAGIRLQSADNNLIGGTHSEAHNVVSGNGLYGIHLRTQSDENEIWGNLIGTDWEGLTAVPNQTGLFVRNSNNNALGGDAPAKGNLIAGNSSNGLRLHDDAGGNLVQHNTVGLNEEGAPLGNGDNGILLDANVTETTIQDNSIVHNGTAGITIFSSSSQNAIYGNSIFENGALGIDLNGDGLTANDVPNDPDAGANNLQNFPDMRSANPLNGEISGTMESAPSTEYRLDFYRNDVCDPTEYGEGQEYLGSGTVTTDATGSQTFTVTLGGFELNDFITATATDPNGNTSEFSICAMAGGSPPGS